MNMSTQSLTTIAIVGGGVEAWLSAVFLARQVSPGIEVVLVETSDEDEVAIASSTLPLFRTINKLLGADEKTLLRHSKGTFKLASTYAGWNPQGQNIFSVPFSNHGFMLNGIDFNQYISALNQGGQPNIVYNRFSVAAMAAQNGKFQHPVNDIKSPFHQLDYGFHLDLVEYKEWLQQQAKDIGLKVLFSESVTAHLSSDNSIDYLSLSDGYRLDADLFIDASGQQSLLFSQLNVVKGMSEEGTNSFSSLFNRVAEFECPERNVLNAETRYIALSNGLLSKIPLQDRDVYRFYYHADSTDEENVAQAVGTLFKRSDLELHFRGFVCSKKDQPWIANCIALGGSFCQLDMFFVSPIDLLCLALMRLLSLLPATGQCSMNRTEFNRLTANELSNVNDYHHLFYHCLGAEKRQGWKKGAIQPSECFQERLGLFKQCGKLPVFEDEIVSMDNWYSMLLQTGHWPEGFDPLVEGIDPNWVVEQLERMAAMMTQAVASMPNQDQYLEQL